MEFTQEEIKLLAECERCMDSGETPYLIWKGQRLAVNNETLQHFGLENHQTINGIIAGAVLKFRVTRCKDATMEEEKKKIGGARPEDFESTGREE